MDIREVEANADALAKHLSDEAPPDLSIIVIMVDRSNGQTVSRAARMDRELYRATLRALLDKTDGSVLS